MSNPLPFLDAPSDSQMRTLLNALNDPSFLMRTTVVPLDDNDVPDAQYALNAVGSIGALTAAYICGSRTCSALGTTAVAKDTLKAVPFLHSNGFRITDVGFSVTTGGAAGSVARCGIYDCQDDLNGNMEPNALLFDSGEFDTTSTGSKSTATTLQLKEGRWYWAVYTCGTNAPTIGTIAVASMDNLMGGSPGASPTVTSHLSVARAYSGGLPATFPSGSTAQTAVPPAIFITYSKASSTLRTRTLPLWAPRSDGYSLRGLRLSRGTSLLADSTSGRPYLILKAQTRTATGAHTLATFDSRKNKLTAGTPFDLLGGDTDVPLAKGQEIVLVVEQYGWPKITVKDTTAMIDTIYTGRRGA